MPEIGINDLEYMIMCYIWEQEKMSLDTIHLMQKLVVDWNKYAQWTENTDLMFILSHLSKILIAADEGKYLARKELYKQNNINWRKVYNIPGARTIEDIVKARKIYEQYARDNPEQEGLSK
jgi:hypothetical protein